MNGTSNGNEGKKSASPLPITELFDSYSTKYNITTSLVIK